MSSPSENQNTSDCRSDDFKLPVFIAADSVILPIGVIGNTLALYVCARLIRRRTASTDFMINLAVSDLLFNLTLPYRIVYYSQREWTLSDFLCPVTIYAFSLNLYCSIFFLMALSVFRYVAVLHPLRSKSIGTVRRALCVSLAICVRLARVPFLCVLPIVGDGKRRCFEPSIVSWGHILQVNYVGLAFGFLIPFLVIVVCYTRITQRLRESAGTVPRAVRSHKRSIYLVAFVLGCFVFCFLPYHIIRTVHLHLLTAQQRDCPNVPGAIQKLIVVTICLAAANSCLNPLLYYFAGENFRSSVRMAKIFRMRSACSGSAACRECSTATSLQLS
ncbi:hypothetical protein scyTo_0026625 [Scyliorhinus torazame]|uniref:G-protein coupled receptors family 1 profile domain-containing protein n=1 Tax=Scyliorhinus torazame TaxID=75743 RepID=A0A401QKM9_SCYTO|nr:hypothetical protein [Scyliorhinus torazame]